MAETWGFAIVGTVHATADRWLEEPTISRETLAAHLTDLLWSGARRASRTGAPVSGPADD